MNVNNILYDEPVETIKARLEEKINRARWTGDWEGIPLRLREKYNDVPSHLQKTMKTMLASIDSMDAFPYQKF
ncbi:MAG: hypothetical protein QXL24_08055, partial [Candidatus Jordarchaeaceae archaeon]